MPKKRKNASKGLSPVNYRTKPLLAIGTASLWYYSKENAWGWTRATPSEPQGRVSDYYSTPGDAVDALFEGRVEWMDPWEE